MVMAENKDKNEELNSSEIMVDKKRRSVTKAGIVAPVVLTLASKSALGVGWDGGRCSISGNMSGNASHPDEGVCEGCTPGYWKNHASKWPSPYAAADCNAGTAGNSGNCKKVSTNDGEYDPDTGTKFADLNIGFAAGFRGTSTQDNTSMIILIEDVSSNWTLHAHAIAALLNTVAGINYGNTTQDILNWWKDTTISDEDLKNRYASLNERSCPL